MKRARLAFAGAAAGILVGIAFLTLADVPRADSAPLASTVGLVDVAEGRWYLRDSSGDVWSFYFGDPGDIPLVGDWDCDGVDSPGMYRQTDGYVYLANESRSQVADIRFFFGDPGDVPIAGDFDGDGCDTVSVYRPAEGRFFIINDLGRNGGGLGAAAVDYHFGDPGDKPIVGDFDGDGVETVGLHRESTGLVYFRQSHTQGVANAQFTYGDPGDRLVAGDWNGDGTDSPGLFRPVDGTFYFRYWNTAGVADHQFRWGDPDWMPVAGAFRLPASPTITPTTMPPTATVPPLPSEVGWVCSEVTSGSLECSGDVDASTPGAESWACSRTAGAWECAGDLDHSGGDESWSCTADLISWRCSGDLTASMPGAETWRCSEFQLEALWQCLGHIESTSPLLEQWECSGSSPAWSCTGNVDRSNVGSESWGCRELGAGRWACSGHASPWSAAFTTPFPLPAGFSLYPYRPS